MFEIRQTQLKNYIFPLIITVIALSVTSIGDSLSDILQYDSKAIAEGEWWRIITAHIVHLGWPHLWLNLAGLVLIFLFFANCVPIPFWWTSFFICALGISVLVYFLNPEIRWYVGLSGVLHGLFVIAGIMNIRIRKWEGIFFSTAILGKVIYEQIAGPLPGSEKAAGGPVLVDAHFYGALIGVVLGIYLFLKTVKKG